MAVEHIQYTDTLRQGADKINAAIDQSNDAIEKATTADANAIQALTTANNVQTQLDTIVIEGDSSVEAAQARVDAEGRVFTTLKERLDTKETQFSSQLETFDSKFESVEEKLKDIAVNVKDFGAVGDGITDDSQSFRDAINTLISVGGGRLIVPYTDDFYAFSSGIEVLIPDAIKIEIVGIGFPEIRLVSDVLTGILAISGINDQPQDTSVVIRGMKLNGIGVPEQWEETNYENLRIVTGLFLKANKVLVEDCFFNNIYGYGVNVQKYSHAVVNNCQFENVGGKWYQNNQYDAFGDAVYFGNAENDTSIAVVSNSRLIAYKQDRPLSRCGIVFEYNAGICVVRDCYIEGYMRGVHIEDAEESQITIENTHFNRYSLATFLAIGAKKVYCKNNRYTNNTGNYNGQVGFFGCYSVSRLPDTIIFDGCYFEIAFSGNAGFTGLKNVKFIGCHFVSNGGLQTINFGSCIIIGCTMIGKVLHLFGTIINIMNGCKLIGVTGGDQVLHLDGNGIIEKMVDCTLEDGYISWEFTRCLFENCNFVKTGNVTLTYDGFLRPYAVNARIKGCTIISPENMNFTVTGWGGADYIGDSYKIINNTYIKVASTVV